MRGYRKFCQWGSKFDKVFLVDDGIEDPNVSINGSSSARQRNAMAFCWRADDNSTFNAGFVALGSRPVLLRNPIFLCFFRGGGSDPLTPPPLDPPMTLFVFSVTTVKPHSSSIPTTSHAHATSQSVQTPVCNKVALFMDIAQDRNIGTATSRICPDNVHYDADAVISMFCGAPGPSTWFKGRKVT